MTQSTCKPLRILGAANGGVGTSKYMVAMFEVPRDFAGVASVEIRHGSLAVHDNSRRAYTADAGQALSLHAIVTSFCRI